jgi:diguanylate cyclase (GGDEF)-like protein
MALPSTLVAVGVAVQFGADVAGPLLAWRLWRTLRIARHAATHDPLTGLPNRRALIAHLTTALAREQPISVAILDLDTFKQVNDRFGHPTGDLVLTAVADRLAASAPPVALAARLGGDEFALIVHAEPATALAALQATRAAINQPAILADGHTISVSASIGVAHHRSGLTGPQLLHHADRALYTAKHLASGVHTSTPDPQQ